MGRWLHLWLWFVTALCAEIVVVVRAISSIGVSVCFLVTNKTSIITRADPKSNHGVITHKNLLSSPTQPPHQSAIVTHTHTPTQHPPLSPTPTHPHSTYTNLPLSPTPTHPHSTHLLSSPTPNCPHPTQHPHSQQPAVITHIAPTPTQHPQLHIKYHPPCSTFWYHHCRTPYIHCRFDICGSPSCTLRDSKLNDPFSVPAQFNSRHVTGWARQFYVSGIWEADSMGGRHTPSMEISS